MYPSLETPGLVTSHSTMLIVVRCSPTQFYIWQKTGCGIRYCLSFETQNWKCWLLKHYLNFWCELNFTVNIFLTYHPEQEIVQIFTHMKLTNLTLLTSKMYWNFKTSCEVILHIWRLCYNMFCKKRSAIIIMNNKQSNLLLKNWLRLHSCSGSSLKNQLQLHSYFRKSLRLWPQSTPTLRLLYTFSR